MHKNLLLLYGERCKCTFANTDSLCCETPYLMMAKQFDLFDSVSREAARCKHVHLASFMDVCRSSGSTRRPPEQGHPRQVVWGRARIFLSFDSNLLYHLRRRLQKMLSCQRAQKVTCIKIVCSRQTCGSERHRHLAIFLFGWKIARIWASIRTNRGRT